jgi:hypothetical protein
MRMTAISLALFCATSVAPTALAETSSAKHDAQAKVMLARVVRELNANPTAALATFNEPTGGFRVAELYVVCFDMRSGKITAHTDRWLLGTKINNGGPPYGPAGKNIFAAARPHRFTRLTFQFPRPGSTEPVPKVSYVTRVDSQGCAVGYYPNLAEAPHAE